MEKDNKKTKERLLDILALIPLALVYLGDVLYIALRGRTYLDSDMASEMILSKILNDEHSITGITTSWFYSTELRVLETQWFYRLGLLIFPHNWLAARTVGMGIMLFLFALAVVLLFRKSGFGKRFAFYSAALCLIPCGSWYLWQTIFGGYYLVYILIAYFSLLWIISSVNSKKKWTSILLCIGIVFLGVGSGLNGVKQLMVFYAPLAIASFIHALYELHNIDDIKKFKTMKSIHYLILSLVASVCSFAGYYINSTILANKYSFENYNETVIQANSVVEQFRNYIWSFGFVEYKKLLSFSGIASMCGLLIGILSVVAAIKLLVGFRKLNDIEQFVTFVFIASISFCIFIYAYNPSAGIQYYQTLVPEGVCVLCIAIAGFKYRFNISKYITEVIMFGFFSLAALGTAYNEDKGPMHLCRIEYNMVSYVDYLQTLGYDKGVATFWKANLITELSNGDIEMWSLKSANDNEIFKFLQRTDHAESFPDGRYFYIFSEGEIDYDAFENEHPELEMIYSDGSYTIFGN